MKSLDYVKEHIDDIEQDNFFDKRFTKRLLDYIPINEWEKFGFEYIGETPLVVKEWTEENILAQLRSDVKFGIEKATNHRGISSSLMADVCKAWCIVLENGLEKTDYGYYGDKVFKALDKYYNFGLVTENTFNNEFYKKW